MDAYGIFDIIGPVMIGPSSSHTAGANRIGYLARAIFGEEPSQVRCMLHGSFYQTRKGHGTDRAILAGVMGIWRDDERIRDAFDIAVDTGLIYSFEHEDLGDVHPNTVKISLTNDSRVTTIVGSSIGGGKVVINKIDATDVEFDGEYTTLICRQLDRPGVIARVTRILADFGVNIAFMRVFRQSKGDIARLIVQLDDDIDQSMIHQIEAVDDILETKLIMSM